MTHLINRVQNSQGKIKLPMSQLIGLTRSDAYMNAVGATMKQRFLMRVFDFTFACFLHL